MGIEELLYEETGVRGALGVISVKHWFCDRTAYKIISFTSAERSNLQALLLDLHEVPC